MTKGAAVQPLQELLDSVVARLEALESAAGIHGPAGSTKRGIVVGPSTPTNVEDHSPAVEAYDEYINKSVNPLVAACKELGELGAVGEYLKDAWAGIRIIVVLASRSKAPQGDLPTELQPHLKPVQTALEAIRKLRLDRKFDWHHKAVMEMMACFSWVLIKPPPQTPAGFCKEASSSCEFWSNKIRKEFKGKDDKHVAFCDSLKVATNDLMAYITEYHRTGLSFNPKGVSLAEAAIMLENSKRPDEGQDLTLSPRRKHLSITGGAGGLSGIMAELAKKQTSDGASAATGLRKVTKDQQTWRKEFKGDKASVVPDVPKLDHAATVKQKTAKKLKGLPICEYQERGHKWVVEHQTKESASGVMTIDISDPKQQVYMYDCEDITVQLKGEKKVKSIIMDSCSRVNLVFDTCISACEVVNSRKIQCQTTGVCPTFSIDKTIGCVIYLSKESLSITSFVTSQSSEMNVSFPDGDEHKEVPIPEQFVHKLVGGNLTSEVSDLYH